MKKQYVKEFFKIGIVASGGGPLIVAIVYQILFMNGVVETLTVPQVVLAIITSMILAFISGGINVVYRIESLPLMKAILLHGVVLYMDYIIIYLVNGWLKRSIGPILIFTVIFVLGYFIIWLFIYHHIKRTTQAVNEELKK